MCVSEHGDIFLNFDSKKNKAAMKSYLANFKSHMCKLFLPNLLKCSNDNLNYFYFC